MPIWRIVEGLPAAYPALTGDLSAEVVVIGAGVTGALVADGLAGEGIDVVLLDGRDVATGSTAASTALLLYDLDVELRDLTRRIGADAAARAYRRSLEAIEQIAALAEDLVECGFHRRASM